MQTRFSLPAYWTDIRALLLVAMALFVFTIVVGILNGTDVVDFDQKTILTHVHAGTLGWLTMAVFAASLWLFGGENPTESERKAVRAHVLVAAVSIPVYALAFLTTYGEWRPIAGVPVLLIILAFFAWVVRRAQKTELTTPHWGFLAALGTSVVGGIFGVLLGWKIATGDNVLPEGGEDAHPATMVVGFLIPVALAMAEWAFTFPKPARVTRLGLWQMGLPFAGGMLLAISLLFDIVPLAPLAILAEVAGVVIFVKRMWPHIRAVDFTEIGAARYGVMAGVGIVFAIGLGQYFVIRYEGDFDLVPTHHLLALDHGTFIGAMTNALFALLLSATANPRLRWPSLDHVVFIGMNAGLVLFIIGLLADTDGFKHAGTPLMGLALLLGLALFAARLLLPPLEDERVAGREQRAATPAQ